MAKLFKSSLPKVITKANHDISLIIENDIAKEAEMLKSLVDQVLAANLEVKKKNNQRITDTKRKLHELDTEISELNRSIDLVDRETVLQQLNEMIDAENKIFTARQEIRFFENENTPQKLESLNIIYSQLVKSIKYTSQVEKSYKKILHDGNNLLFDKQLEVTNDIISLMGHLYDQKREFIQEKLNALSNLKAQIFDTERHFNEFIKENLNHSRLLQLKSSSSFTAVDDDIFIGEKIIEDNKLTIETLNARIITIQEKYEIKKNEIISNYQKFENLIREKHETKNAIALNKEKQLIEKQDQELKNIRLLIIDAEKKENYSKVQSLLKQFDKLEKSKISKVSDKTDKLFTDETKKARDKAITQLKNLNRKLVLDINKQELGLKLEAIKFEEAKILYKIKSDYNSMITNIATNKKIMQTMSDFLNEKERVTRLLYGLKLQLRKAELQIMKENEITDNDLVSSFKDLLQALKVVEHKRILFLQENSDNHELIKIEQQYNINKTVLDLQLEKEINDIDKLILRKRNESLIRIEKVKEDANNEVIYQESLIRIAQKEHDLQLVKVKSLYENERSLAEEQIERINLGVQVNDAFVKTTLENQLLFATQQIRCAESEYDIRVESVALTKDQELTYAHKKIDYYRQKYEYNKSKIRKELEDKLEDLRFKLLLFTDKKENREIQNQINDLSNQYQKLIDAVEEEENQDKEIARYEKVISEINNRAEQAINEALALKEQTSTAFEALFEQTKTKYDQIEASDHSEDTVGIMPLLNSSAVSSADQRLQQAIKEADELYNDRIENPKRIIKETQDNLIELTKDEETEIFCNEQKQVKKQKYSNHNDEVAKLNKEKENIIEDIKKAVAKKRKTYKETLTKEREALFSAPLYRDEEKIAADYKVLNQNEITFSKTRIKEVSDFRTERLIEHKKIIKETNNWIKLTFKPYKKYIRYASRGLTAEKKEIIRKNKRVLKNALSDANDNFETII